MCILNIFYSRYSQHMHGHWSVHSLQEECTPCHHEKIPALEPNAPLYLKSGYSCWCLAATPCKIVLTTCLHLGTSSMITCQQGACGFQCKKSCTWLPTQFVQDLQHAVSGHETNNAPHLIKSITLDRFCSCLMPLYIL